jgi:hypothetical protein
LASVSFPVATDVVKIRVISSLKSELAGRPIVTEPSASDKAPGQVKKTDDKDKKSADHEQMGSDRHGPPANWHRYDRRPDDWSTRGCIMFGPVWWCP